MNIVTELQPSILQNSGFFSSFEMLTKQSCFSVDLVLELKVLLINCVKFLLGLNGKINSKPDPKAIKTTPAACSMLIGTVMTFMQEVMCVTSGF